MITLQNVLIAVLICYAIALLVRAWKRQQLMSAVSSCVGGALQQFISIPHIEVQYSADGRVEFIRSVHTQPIMVDELPSTIRLAGPSWPVELNLNVTLSDSTQHTEPLQLHRQDPGPELSREFSLDVDVVEPYDTIHIFLNEWRSSGRVFVTADLVLN